MYLKPLSPRPSPEERQERFRVGMKEINGFIEKLEKVYERTQDPDVWSVLQGLQAVRARRREDIWVQEDVWRKQEEIEAFIYFDQLPHSVQIFLLNDKLNS